MPKSLSTTDKLFDIVEKEHMATLIFMSETKQN